MDSITSGNDSGNGGQAPEKWLERIAALQAQVRAFKAQLSVARGLVTGTVKTANKWDSGGMPCWCAMPDGGDEVYTAHSIACAHLRRLTRALDEELVEPAP